jgi:hypothetical protein
MRGVVGQPVADLNPFVGGVVVHHQVQLSLGVGAGYLLEEAQELVRPVPGLVGGGDLAGRDRPPAPRTGGRAVAR